MATVIVYVRRDSSTGELKIDSRQCRNVTMVATDGKRAAGKDGWACLTKQATCRCVKFSESGDVMFDKTLPLEEGEYHMTDFNSPSVRFVQAGLSAWLKQKGLKKCRKGKPNGIFDMNSHYSCSAHEGWSLTTDGELEVFEDGLCTLDQVHKRVRIKEATWTIFRRWRYDTTRVSKNGQELSRGNEESCLIYAEGENVMNLPVPDKEEIGQGKKGVSYLSCSR